MVFRHLGILAAVLVFSSAELITGLPGAPLCSSIRQHSGYLDVGTDGHLHYWFIESQSNPATDPVLLWLNGGPGCSSLFGVLTEWGPYRLNEDGTSFNANPYAWTRNASVLALESPVGVGYSYSDGNITSSDEKTADENWDALKAFFTELKQYQNNDFYLTGESYAGIYIPTLAAKILERQSEFQINLKGYAIGNGLLNDAIDTDTQIQFMYSHGMIDEEEWENITSKCCDGRFDDCNWHQYLEEMNTDTLSCTSFVRSYTVSFARENGLNIYDIYGKCINNQGKYTAAKNYKHYLDQEEDSGNYTDPGDTIPCVSGNALRNYLNRGDVRKAIHIKADLPIWQECNFLLHWFYEKTVSDTTQYVKTALAAGLRVLLYYGDTDMACNFMGGQRFAKSLGYQKTKPKTAYKVDGQVGGFHSKYGNLDFVTVRGAGHMVPTDKPAVALHIIDAFINNRDISFQEDDLEANIMEA